MPTSKLKNQPSILSDTAIALGLAEIEEWVSLCIL
jgi:hypothetical protein